MCWLSTLRAFLFAVYWSVHTSRLFIYCCTLKEAQLTRSNQVGSDGGIKPAVVAIILAVCICKHFLSSVCASCGSFAAVSSCDTCSVQSSFVSEYAPETAVHLHIKGALRGCFDTLQAKVPVHHGVPTLLAALYCRTDVTHIQKHGLQ